MITLIQFLKACQANENKISGGWLNVINTTGRMIGAVSPVMVKQAVKACRDTIRMGFDPQQVLAETVFRLDRKSGRSATADYSTGSQQRQWPPRAMPQPQSSGRTSSAE